MNEEIARHLQNHGIRPTAVRILIWKTLQNFDYAFAMADLEGWLPTVDKSTLFRALTLFSEKELLHTLDDGSGEKKYCPCIEHVHCDDDGHSDECRHATCHPHTECQHVHLTCTICGKTYCLKNQKIPQVDLPEGFKIETIQYIIHGVCAKCAHNRK